MSERLGAIEAALKAGRTEEGIAGLISLLTEDPAQTAQVYRALLLQLYRAGRQADGEAWSAKAVAQFPRDAELWNIRGVFLRQLGRQPEALEALDQGVKIAPNSAALLVNKGNVLLDLGDGVGAEAIFGKLVRADPRNAEAQRQLGRALQKQGKIDQAMVRWRQATALKKDYIDAWLDLVGTLNDLHRTHQAHEILDKAIAANPGHPRLYEAHAILFRRAGDLRKAEAYLTGLLPQFPEAAWLHHQIGVTVADYDRLRANELLRRAVELEPGNPDYVLSLVESLERTRIGDEGAHIEEAYQIFRRQIAGQRLTSSAHLKIATELLIRVCAYDELDQLGSFAEVGRIWAKSGRHTALLKQLARVRSEADRLELVEQHRIWGRDVEATAKRNPIRRPPPRPKDGKIRVGFMSSDLRRHPVAYFALPLFDHIDPRFEVYCYSYYQGEEDPVQAHIRERVAGFRWRPDIGARDAAQMIADDQLDILLELGGTTHMNKLDVMAWRPAPKQASWLGYPHSAGLSTIDYFVCDPFSRPTRPELFIETPLVMPHSWLALGRMFSDSHPIEPGLPEERAGHITFGTANNPHKYGREVLRTWAQVTASVPGAKFAFIRPEGGTESFRTNVLAAFAAEGVGADRVIFHTVRGAHMPFYNQVDITLDPFPLTGGTTTCEALWMGVPVVSLRGEAFYERLSYSILSNAGAPEMCAADLDGYRQIALDLVGDRERRRALRTGLRDQIKASPLGQGEAFARDFYEMLAGAVGERRGG